MATLEHFEMPDPRWPVPASVLADLWLDGDQPAHGGKGGTSRHDPSDDKADKDLNDELEDALEDTFPASDPVSVSQTTTTGAPGEFRKKQ